MVSEAWKELCNQLKFCHAEGTAITYLFMMSDEFFEENNIEPDTRDYDKWVKEGYFIFPIESQKYMVSFSMRVIRNEMKFNVNIYKETPKAQVYTSIFQAYSPMNPGELICRKNESEKNPKILDYIERIKELFKKLDVLWEGYDTYLRPSGDTEAAPTTPITHALDVLRMDLASLRYPEYVTDTMSISEFMKLDIDDVNYSDTIYWCPEPSLLIRIQEKFKEWMLGRMYRIGNVRMNGLFYIENCDLQDVSEVGYDRLENLIGNGKLVKITKEEK